MTPRAEVIDITDVNVARAQAFLARSPETSLFLLSNIRGFGTRLGPSLYSGNLKGLVERGELGAVFCLTRGGSVLAETGGRTDLAGEIVRACRAEGLQIRGVLAEWPVSKAIWDLLSADGRLRPTLASKEVMYRLPLSDAATPEGLHERPIRMLTPDDHDQWERLSVDFQSELGLPLLGDREQRKAAFVRSAGLGHWWGAFDDQRLVSLGGIIALHEAIAQIGGVFTPTAWRRQGLCRAVMRALIRDSRTVHRLDRLFLFTGENNVAARRLYESLGFESFGHFGLFFGE